MDFYCLKEMSGDVFLSPYVTQGDIKITEVK